MDIKKTAFGHHKQRPHLKNSFAASILRLQARSLADGAKITVVDKLITGKAGGNLQAAFNKLAESIQKDFTKANPDYTEVPVTGRPNGSKNVKTLEKESKTVAKKASKVKDPVKPAKAPKKPAKKAPVKKKTAKV